MKILAMLSDGYGARGGIARYNCDLLRALSECSSVSQVLVVPRQGSGQPDLPRKVRQLSPQPGKIGWSLRSISTAMGIRPDVVFCGHLHAVPLAAIVARVLSRPLWVQIHGIEAWSCRSSLVARAVRSAALVTSVSRFTRRRFLQWCDIAPDRCRVLPNTVSDVFSRPASSRDLAVRYGLEDRKVILTVGRMSSTERYKGHDRVIAALPDVRMRCPQAAYLIVGDGDDRVRLAGLATQHGVREHVIFAGGVPDHELAQHFALADVFAMPSTGEGFGIVFLEAAACGVPVIGGCADGSMDALAEGRIGAAIAPDDAAQLADAIVCVLQDPPPRDPDAVRRFAFANFAKHVDDLMRQVISQQQQASALSAWASFR